MQITHVFEANGAQSKKQTKNSLEINGFANMVLDKKLKNYLIGRK